MLVFSLSGGDSGDVSAGQILHAAPKGLTQSDEHGHPVDGHSVVLDLVDPVL
jgi:hypothetical protein